MTVLNFASPRNLPSDWKSAEVQKLLSGCAASLKSGELSGWEVGKTDAGDPQLYLLGAAPDFECLLTVSRLNGRYILEDGEGNVLFENGNLLSLAQQTRAALCRKKIMLFAKAALLWAAFREVLEEKIEPLMAEPIEIATHIAPQLAAFV